MTNLIGNGEDVVHDILKDSLSLTAQESLQNFSDRKDGIYRQIPIPKILSDFYLQDLAEYHRKGSIDIAIIIKGHIYAIRVQGGGTTKQKKGGHYGDHKSKTDSVQKQMLVGSGIEVIDIWQHECPNVFKNKFNEKAMEELKNSFYGSSLLQFIKNWCSKR